MKIKGTIESRKRVRYKNQECHGIAYGHRQSFRIRISESTFDNPVLYAETMFHELTHLWFFLLMGTYKLKVSEGLQHRFIKIIMPFVKALAKPVFLKEAKRRQP